MIRQETESTFSKLRGAVQQGGKVQVRREHGTSAGRYIDIVVDVSHFRLGIENKPWAADLKNQVRDYIDDLMEYSKDRWAFIYLSGYGAAPSKKSLCTKWRQELLESGHYVELDYANDLAQWPQQCALACEADKIRWLLKDFRTYTLRGFKSFDSTEGDNAG